MPDKRQRFLFDNFPIRGELVQLSQTLTDIFAQHPYPEPVKKLMGEFMLASALLSATIKFKGTLILQVKGSGQISMLMAECSSENKLRAIAHHSDNLDEQQPLLGKGQMAITIEPAKGSRYQGIVSIEDNQLSTLLENYFLQSEQLRTRFWLSATASSAAGMLLQAMPESASVASLNIDSEHWNRVTMLCDTLQDEELLQLDNQVLLHRLFHEEDLRLFDPAALEFACSCSAERSEKALLAMGESETRTLLAERGGSIDVDCQFCNAKYTFDEQAINRLFQTRVH